MRKILTRLTLILVFCIGVSAFSKLQSQIVVAKWDFGNTTKQDAITDNASFASSPYTADDGIVENKDIATISLGGSVNYIGWVTGASGTPDKAPNSNAWNLTDGYWQIGIVTTGYKDLTLSSKQQSSNTGPTDFQIQYSTDNGSSWLDVGTAITVANNFTSGVVTDLALPAECNNLANLLIRWTNTSNVSVGGTTVASGGTNRIDDIVVMGTLDDPCLATVPFFEGFENGYNHDDVVEGCWTQESETGTATWVVNSTNTTYNRTPRTGLFNATLQYSNKDWLFYKVNLIQGQAYDFTVWARQDATSGATLTLAWGAEDNSAAMTNIIVDAQVITNGDYQEVKGTFGVPTDGVYYIGIKGSLTFTPNYMSIDDISLDFGPTCVAPENIQASNITSDATTITWDASITSVAAYNVYSSDVNTAPADDIANSEYTEVSGLTTTLSSLSANTKYYVWVRSDCGSGDYSAWAGPISFTTTQVPAILPYEDDFATNQFTFINGTQTNQWAYGSAEGNPANAIYISNDDGTTNAYTNYSAISTVQAYRDIVIPTGTTIVNFSFDWKCYGESSYDYLRVWLVPTSYIPTAGTQITAGTGRIQIGGNFNQQDTWQTYQNLVLDISSFAGQTMRLVFEWKNDYSGGTQPPAAIDNVNISIPSCIAPTNLQASLTGLKSANLTWTAPTSVPANGYQIFSNTTGVAPSESSTPVITVAATETSFATGDVLDLANTTYYAWIRSDCGGDFSSWAGPATVTTPMYVPSPWVEEFATSTTPTGWTTSSMSLNNSNSAIINGGASGYYMYKNLYSTTYSTGNFSTVLIGPITGTEDFSFDYKIANYYSPYAPPASGTGNFVLEISTDFGNTWSEIETVSNNGVAGWQTKAYDLSTYVNTGDFLKFRITANWISGDYCIGFDNFNLASCLPVSDLSASNITNASATISWTASGSNPDDYQVYVSLANIAPAEDETNIEISNTNSIDLTGLEDSPLHYVWVRSDCGAGDISEWVGPLALWTSCEPIVALPYTENFDAYGTGTTAFPNCWSKPETYNSYPYIVDAYSVSSPASLRFNSSTTTPTYAVSPAFAEDIQNLRVSFQLRAESTTYSGTIELGVMSAPNDISTFESVATIQPTNTSFNYYYYDLYLATLSGANNHIAFRHNSNSDYYCYWLDNFEVDLSPTCIEPNGFAVNSVTANSASISWTESITLPENGYDIYFSTTATAPTGSSTPTHNTNETSFLFENLDESTNYYVWIRANCNNADQSDWTGPLHIYTGYCIPTNTSTSYWISSLTTTGGITNISHTGITSQPGGYGDFSAIHSCSNVEGQPTMINFAQNTYTGYYFCWIDWNNDMQFDATERIIATTTYSSTYQGTINIPAGTEPGEYRMRVANSYLYEITDACTGSGYGQFFDYTFVVVQPANDETDILTYSFAEQIAPANIDDVEHKVYVTVAAGTNLNGLVATFTLSEGASATVMGLPQESGVTPNNFTYPVVYKVVAENGLDEEFWQVIVDVDDTGLSSEANILTYSFAEQYSPATIDELNHTVNIMVNEGVDRSNLVATFTLSDGASAKIGTVDQQSGVTPNNFTDPVIYTVTAENGTTIQPWTVTVSVYVGIEDVESSALTIYPNPNKGNFTLDFTNINGKVNYQIYDTKGSIILSDDFVANGSAIKEVSLNLVPGVYFVRLVTETQSLIEKLVVE